MIILSITSSCIPEHFIQAFLIALCKTISLVYLFYSTENWIGSLVAIFMNVSAFRILNVTCTS